MSAPLKSISRHLRRLISQCRSGTGDSLLVEGERLVLTAAGLSPAPASHLLSSCPRLLARLRDRPLRASSTGTDCALVTESLLAQLTDAATPPACLAVFPKPSAQRLSNRLERQLEQLHHQHQHQAQALLDFSLLCWEVADPANVGSIARLGWCLGARRLLLTPGCANPWLPKAVRAGAGAHFRLSIVAGAEFDAAGLAAAFGHVVAAWPQPSMGGSGGLPVTPLDSDERLYRLLHASPAAGSSPSSPPPSSLPPLCLLLGSEARGLPLDLMKQLLALEAERRVAVSLLHVPMMAAGAAGDDCGAGCSLNVASAAAIILHRLVSVARRGPAAAAAAGVIAGDAAAASVGWNH